MDIGGTVNATVELLEHTPNPEKLIEIAGRTAYRTQDKITKDSAARFVASLIRHGHLSVLEHASATFRVREASRAFTHQVVRHRLCSFTQQSQRYVSEEAFDYVVPASVTADAEALRLYTEDMERTAETYSKLAAKGVPREDARFVLPNATASEIVITANFRQWRHIVDLRGEHHAQWEIRTVVLEILRHLQLIAPNVFGDYEIRGDVAVSRLRSIESK